MKQLYNKFYQAMDIDKMIRDTTELMYVEMPQTYTAYGKVVQKFVSGRGVLYFCFRKNIR